MKKLFFILLFAAFSFPIFAQQNMEGTTLNRGKIFTADEKIIDGQYIVFTKDSVEYYLENSRDRNVIGLNQVTEVQKYDGHYGNTGLWIGGIAGIGIGVAVALGTKETKTTGFIEETTIQTWPIYVFAAVGSLAGYLIGSAVEDWDTVYEKEIYGQLKNIYLEQNQFGGISLSYHFNLK